MTRGIRRRTSLVKNYWAKTRGNPLVLKVKSYKTMVLSFDGLSIPGNGDGTLSRNVNASPILAARFVFLLMAILALTMIGCHDSASVPETPPEEYCQHKLERIGRAIVAYRAEHGDLPSIVKGPGGEKHSWRVALSKYVLAKSSIQNTIDYRFDEPWNSSHNRKCLEYSTLPGYYTCPVESDVVGYPNTTYLMLVRTNASNAKRSARSPLPQDAIIIVESARCGIKCGEPRDLEWDTIWQGSSPFGPGKLESLHPGVVKGIRLDGKVIDIPKSMRREELRQLLEGTVMQQAEATAPADCRDTVERTH